jgi:predicted MFS family arabinose efflux permease
MSDARVGPALETRPASTEGFLGRFLALSIVSGASIALGRIATHLYAIHLGASPAQIGAIMGAEQAMMMLVAVPAGFLVSRMGVRASYFTASIGPTLVYLAMPFAATWPLLGAARALIGLCIPFRIVSMNTAFLRELPAIGREKAGWYRGSQTMGLTMIGPALAAAMTSGGDYAAAFVASGLMFGLMGSTSLSFFPDTRAMPEVGVPVVPFHGQLAALLRQRTIFESCVIEHFSSATTALFATFVLMLAIREMGIDAQTAVSLITIQGCGTVAALFLLNRVFMRLGRTQAYLGSLAGGIAALLCIGTASGYAALAAGAILLSLAAASVHFQNMTQLSRSPVDKSKASGLFNFAGMSGNFVGSAGGGLVSTIVTLRHLYLLWISVLLVAAAVIFWRNRMGVADA